MSVKFKDYYQILGVKRDASQDEVHRAYRKLARQYHPDVNKSPDAASRFSEINEAYEVLKDPDKRTRYDQLGANWKAGQEFTPPPGGGRYEFNFGTGPRGGGFSPGGFSEFFEMFFGRGGRGEGGAEAFEELLRQGGARGAGPGRAGRGGSGGPGRAGHGTPEDVFEQMGAGAFGAASQAAPEAQAELTISLEEACHGTTRQLKLATPDGNTRTVDVKVPAGTTDGSKMRLKGENVLLTIRIAPHRTFTPEGNNLIVDLPLAPWEAALGAKVSVPTIDGPVTLTVPPGTQSGQKLRLKGRGLPRRGQGPDGQRGDLLARTRIVLPRKLSDEQHRLLEQLKEASTDFDPRADR